MEARTLVSFDIDGTLETGDPAGPLRLAFVRWARARGYVIGSCSDRTLGEQSAMWARAGIVPDFVSRKHELTAVRAAWRCQRFVHIGDTRVDEHFAAQADFEFIFVFDLASRLAAIDLITCSPDSSPASTGAVLGGMNHGEDLGQLR
ncbi:MULTISPECIES: HAD family hydrolase [Pseudofrankia]|uniref:HAD family hydrolase n=1 Tax=Pseudofrankia TaxID=2994363 RepID=UPI000234B74F|nr:MULTISPECIES: HAD family hydrolase [Pseudofrankia]OHV30427.1 hypothetical protein BCD49_33810 [Pseudofrankia sp. EUN1h]